MIKLKDWTFKKLMKGVDPSIFTQPAPDNLIYNLRTKLLLSDFLRKIYDDKLANLIHFVNLPPFSDGSKCFGRIGDIQQMEEGIFALRGWIFHPQHRIKSLSLIAEGIRYPIYAFHINRLDVNPHFKYFSNSLFCGLVGTLEDLDLTNNILHVAFEATTEDDQIRIGKFEPVKVIFLKDRETSTPV